MRGQNFFDLRRRRRKEGGACVNARRILQSVLLPCLIACVAGCASIPPGSQPEQQAFAPGIAEQRESADASKALLIATARALAREDRAETAATRRSSADDDVMEMALRARLSGAGNGASQPRAQWVTASPTAIRREMTSGPNTPENRLSPEEVLSRLKQLTSSQRTLPSDRMDNDGRAPHDSGDMVERLKLLARETRKEQSRMARSEATRPAPDQPPGTQASIAPTPGSNEPFAPVIGGIRLAALRASTRTNETIRQ